MSEFTNPNRRLVALLMFLGAIPALPSIYIIYELLQGPPPIGADAVVSLHHYETPLPLILHGIGGIIFAALVPFQVSNRTRNKGLKRHKFMGKLVFGAAILLSFSALYIINHFPLNGGAYKYALMLVTSIFILAGCAISLGYIRKRNVKMHRIWMLRVIAVTYGGSTAALVAIPVFVIYGDVSGVLDASLRWAGLVINIVVLECYLRRDNAALKHISTV